MTSAERDLPQCILEAVDTALSEEARGLLIKALQYDVGELEAVE